MLLIYVEIKTKFKLLSLTMFSSKISFCPKGTSSTQKGNKANNDKHYLKDEKMNCQECNCLQKKSLKNHMLTKHDDHQCKECIEKLSNFMQLLKHIAKHHTDNESEI